MSKKEQTDGPSTMPQLEIVNRVQELPVVSWAVGFTTSTWSWSKNYHPIIDLIFNRAEVRMNRDIADAASIAAPVARSFEKEIRMADRKLCDGLNVLENKVPIVKAPPQQIYDAAKGVISSWYSYYFSR